MTAIFPVRGEPLTRRLGRRLIHGPGKLLRKLSRLPVDWGLTAAVVALCLLGTMLVWASTRPRLLAAGEDPQAYLKRQIANVLAGLALMAVIAFADRGTLRAWTPPVYLLACLSLLAVLTPLGRTANGAQSWLGLGPLQMQPAELAKPALVLALAALLSDPPDGERRPHGLQVLLALTAAAVPLGLVMLQPDLGTVLILAATVLAMLIVSGVRWRWIALMVLAGAAAAALAWWLGLLRPHQVQRLLAFTDPMADPQGSGYNALQALTTVGSGGLFGQGLLRGEQTAGRYVPEQHTDFVFTVAGEELGFAGAMLTLALLWTVLSHALRTAARAATLYGALSAAGIACWLAVQTFVNIGMAIGLAPVTGVPLPFVSYGGSSIAACLAAMGILMSIRRQDVHHL